MIYDKPLKYWNQVFSKEEVRIPKSSKIPIDALNQAMDWLIHDGDQVLDFGCGSGSLLFYAELKGAMNMTGIDLSEKAIELANKRASKMSKNYHFIKGDVKTLAKLKSQTYDSVILSNIIDNLTEEDMMTVLREVARLLKDTGRLLIKMNDYIEEKDFNKYHIKVIQKDLLDDGLLLLNKTTTEWKNIFSKWYTIEKADKVYFESFDASNRIFLLKKSL